MSKMIPKETVDALRNQHDVSVDMFGIECSLYIPNNLNSIENKDAYIVPSDITFNEYLDSLVSIEWKPGMQRLRKIGIFAEGEIPIIAWFKNYPVVTLKSYIKLETRFIPDVYDTDEFEIVDIFVPIFHDAEITRCFKLAPRRVTT